MTIVLLGFLGILLFVDICGVNTYLSIFSNFERMAGFILYFSVIAYFFIISTIVNTPKRWVIFGIFLSAIVFIVSVKGIIQSYNHEEMLNNFGRVVATVGNANQLAFYLISGFFIVAILINEWILPAKKTQPKLTVLYLIIATVFLFTYALCLLKTSTRGSLIGLILGILLMLILTLWNTKQQKIKLISGSILLTLIIGISALFYFRKTPFIQQNSALNRITRIVDNDGTNTLQSRLENYKVAIEGIKAKPLLGWGQETYHYTYAQFFNPKLYQDATWYDRVHNVILEWLIIGGIIGFIAYLSIWGAVLYQLWRKNNSFSISTKIIISGFLLAYFVGNLSLFDNLLSLMAFMTVMAFIENRTSPNVTQTAFKVNNKAFLLSSFSILVMMFFVIKITCQQAYQTNKSIVQAYSAESLEEVIDIYAKAYPKAIIGRQEIAEQLANMAKDIATNPIPENTKKHYFEVAKNMMLSEIEQYPDYARLQILYGNLLEAQGDNLGAIKTLEKVQKLAPKRQSNLVQLAMLYAKNREFNKANTLLENTYLLEKQNEEPKVYQIILITMSGEVKDREKLVNQLSDKTLNKFIIEIQNFFAKTGDLNTFLELCTKRFLGNINTLPNTYQVWATTAYNVKNFEQAATAVYAFRRHYSTKENFRDSQEADKISQDVLKGKDPSFAFEKAE
ncbi:O-antigen ligase [Arcicella aurantiaca]|uniref:O-antigen ligase n=1 Tax=Arcicella aurantiaca TaxID=591202 RepID=A0A316E9S5_9BACT|nr:O-antigen ligase family protein [Arcicella aurantiaca]PWK26398.1 O-antigen ligase [Arcicella aurantiaca]